MTNPAGEPDDEIRHPPTYSPPPLPDHLNRCQSHGFRRTGPRLSWLARLKRILDEDLLVQLTSTPPARDAEYDDRVQRIFPGMLAAIVWVDTTGTLYLGASPGDSQSTTGYNLYQPKGGFGRRSDAGPRLISRIPRTPVARKALTCLARPAGLEPATRCLEGSCSVR